MIILPAIDLYGGRAVRLEKGDFTRMTVYDTEPLSRARAIHDAGARWLHLVDLEGAKTGQPAHGELIRQIVEETSLSVELGGGIRSLSQIAAYLDCGVTRVILGTAAVENENLLRAALDEYGPERIAVGMDVLDGLVAVRGWAEKSDWTAEAFAGRLAELGIRTVICTDISKDGMLSGCSRELYAKLNESFPLELIASGGVSSEADIRALAGLGMSGAIIGKAYYSGALSIEAALRAASGATDTDKAPSTSEKGAVPC
ncbi:MAG: 1-(5-phosphoribosyl)-5-[(5-phosphoribosylamino)methylideneamino]imidazole-4-carboxamide isomerase [Oscillospiraceae bacterium]|nr:1-(5-phosphoribosyl)-5-[(5-phosphoribosylamino)methylideneamino]imidazole-4-carboxamide isomerase [Oscillospiraceae bacterium]